MELSELEPAATSLILRKSCLFGTANFGPRFFVPKTSNRYGLLGSEDDWDYRHRKDRYSPPLDLRVVKLPSRSASTGLVLRFEQRERLRTNEAMIYSLGIAAGLLSRVQGAG